MSNAPVFFEERSYCTYIRQPLLHSHCRSILSWFFYMAWFEWDYLSPINLIETYRHLVVLGTGLAFGFVVGRMILAHLCDEPKGLKTIMCLFLVYLPFALANALTARLNAGRSTYKKYKFGFDIDERKANTIQKQLLTLE
ncbi:unnamed protein product [Eruca vesicaria subsp. sativa]|uniref:Uncharacterized protein n=1 Tax=Eruca vesicaria subsp. sativa TaxID=29727 RepID=A0ABC8JTQ9_ERUVS|nr:unnamed protein product [Eruca vesicaria subsp. sativa]